MKISKEQLLSLIIKKSGIGDPTLFLADSENRCYYQFDYKEESNEFTVELFRPNTGKNDTKTYRILLEES